MGDRGGDRSALQSEPVDEAPPDIAIDAVTGNDRDLREIVGRIGDPHVSVRRNRQPAVLGDDQPGFDADHRQIPFAAGNLEIGRRNRVRLHTVKTDRLDRRPAVEQGRLHNATCGDDRVHRARLEIIDEYDIRAAAGRDHPAIAQPESTGGRPARRAVDMVKRASKRDQRAHHVIEMALLVDVERIAIVRAQAHETRRILVEHLGERAEIL